MVPCRTVEQCSDELPDEPWREKTVGKGSQRLGIYMFCAQTSVGGTAPGK